ncbi:MAG: GtrA family protein [Pseudomonadota bacterium]
MTPRDRAAARPATTLVRFWRYVLVGGAAAIVDLGGFVGLDALGAPVPAAAAMSFLIAMAVNYALSIAFAFGAQAGLRSFALFAAFAAIGFSINVGVTAGLALLAGLWPPLAKLLGIAVAFTFNFTANHIIVFPQPGGAGPRRR